MRFWHKLVSAGVLATFLLLPFVSMATCLPKSAAAASMTCEPDCPMMAKATMMSGHQSELKSDSDGSCCTMTSGKSAPVTVASVIPSIALIEVAPTDVAFVIPLPIRAATAADASPPPLPRTQALLCTFLI